MALSFGLFGEEEKKVLQHNRDMIDCNPEKHHEFLEGETLIVHIYENDGRYQKEYIKYQSLEQVAEIIKMNDKHKLICNSDDYAIIAVMYSYIDQMNLAKETAEKLVELI